MTLYTECILTFHTFIFIIARQNLQDFFKKMLQNIM